MRSHCLQVFIWLVDLTGRYDSTDYGYDVNKQKVFYYQDYGNPFDLDNFNRLDVGFRSRASFYAKRLVVNLDYETNLELAKKWLKLGDRA